MSGFTDSRIGTLINWLCIQVKGQEGEGPKMVPKRQIHRKKKDNECIIKEATEKLQVVLASVHHPSLYSRLSTCLCVYLSVYLSR